MLVAHPDPWDSGNSLMLRFLRDVASGRSLNLKVPKSPFGLPQYVKRLHTYGYPNLWKASTSLRHRRTAHDAHNRVLALRSSQVKWQNLVRDQACYFSLSTL